MIETAIVESKLDAGWNAPATIQFNLGENLVEYGVVSSIEHHTGQYVKILFDGSYRFIIVPIHRVVTLIGR